MACLTSPVMPRLMIFSPTLLGSNPLYSSYFFITVLAINSTTGVAFFWAIKLLFYCTSSTLRCHHAESIKSYYLDIEVKPGFPESRGTKNSWNLKRSMEMSTSTRQNSKTTEHHCSKLRDRAECIE